MSKFKAFEELTDPLVLPIGGKEYTIAPLGAADGIRFTLASDPKVEPEDVPGGIPTDDEVNRMFLGAAYDQMIADNIPGPALTRAVMAAMADHKAGRVAAQILWETGGDPKAVTQLANKLANKAKRKQPTDRATSTKRPDSTSGTNSQKGSPGRKAKAPLGLSSSSSGD